jgi:hypothetical protein
VSVKGQSTNIAVGTIPEFPALPPGPPIGSFEGPGISGSGNRHSANNGLPQRPPAPRVKRVTHDELRAAVRDYCARQLEEGRRSGAVNPIVPQLYRALEAGRRVDIFEAELEDKKTRLDAGLPTNIDQQAPADLSKLGKEEIEALKALLVKSGQGGDGL